jgi:hypothetical protein
MTAEIHYILEYGASPLLSEKRRQEGTKAWTLCRAIRDELGHTISYDHVAIFDRDDYAEVFQRFLLGGGTIECSEDAKELYQLQRERKAP